jgi:hypothetical protein
MVHSRQLCQHLYCILTSLPQKCYMMHINHKAPCYVIPYCPLHCSLVQIFSWVVFKYMWTSWIKTWNTTTHICDRTRVLSTLLYAVYRSNKFKKMRSVLVMYFSAKEVSVRIYVYIYLLYNSLRKNHWHSFVKMCNHKIETDVLWGNRMSKYISYSRNVAFITLPPIRLVLFIPFINVIRGTIQQDRTASSVSTQFITHLSSHHKQKNKMLIKEKNYITDLLLFEKHVYQTNKILLMCSQRCYWNDQMHLYNKFF